MIGDTIKWRIKVKSITNGMLLGIGLKSVLENKNYIVNDWSYDKHGCNIVQ